MTETLLQNREKDIFRALIVSFFLFAGFYIYCVNVTVHNVVAREDVENEISKLTLSIGREEFAYITMRNEITLPLAYAKGFQDVSVKTFISSKNSDNQVSYVTR